MLDYHEQIGVIKYHLHSPPKIILADSRKMAREFRIKDVSLSATLLWCELLEDYARVFMYGDGVIAYGTDGVLEVIDREFESGAPYYLIYEHSGREEYWEKFGTKYKNTFWTNVMPKSPQIVESEQLIDTFIPFNIIREVGFICIMSDGIKSFRKTVETGTSKTTEPVSMYDVMERMFKFKIVNENFLKRRINAEISMMAKESIHNYDDLSVAIFHFGDKNG
jgi:hypothetical protein